MTRCESIQGQQEMHQNNVIDNGWMSTVIITLSDAVFCYVMLHWSALYYRNIDIHWYLLYYRNDLNCAMSGDWNGEISWFVPPLSLSQLCQPNHKKQFIKFGVRDFENKFFNNMTIIFFNNNKTRCTYFNPLMSCRGTKRSNILK